MDIFRDEGGDKNKNNRVMSLHIADDKLLQIYKTIWTKIKDLKNNELDALLVYEGRYKKVKVGAYGNKVYTNFRVLNVLENGAECESFTVISIDSLRIYENKYYLEVYLENCFADKKMIYYLEDNVFEADED